MPNTSGSSDGRGYNFHAHTPRCHHASGSVEDFCRVAVANHFHLIGFSEHAPNPDPQFDPHVSMARFINYRMAIEDRDGYLDEIERARSAFPELTILTGLEIDYVRGISPETNRAFFESWHLDYTIGSVHWIQCGESELYHFSEVTRPETVCAAMEQNLDMVLTAAIDICAHPDASAHVYRGDYTSEIEARVRRLARAARDREIPLEINANGLRNGKRTHLEHFGYPWIPFWRTVAEEGAPVVIGADAHSPDTLIHPSIETCYEFAESLNLDIRNAWLADRLGKRHIQAISKG